MTFIRAIETTSVTLVNEDAAGLTTPVARVELGGNNETPQRNGRLRLAMLGNYPAEVEIEPGPESHPVGGIASQLMLWGPRTLDGKHRQRLSVTIAIDPNGGASGVIDSTTNDPSNSAGQSFAMPLVVNAGEGRGLFFVLYPADNTIGIQDRKYGVEWRGTATELVALLAANRPGA